MTDGSASKSLVVAVFELLALTVGWVIGSAGGVWVTMMVAFTGWKNPDRPGYLEPLSWVLGVTTVAFFYLSPLGIAAVAREAGLRRTAIAYRTLTGLLIVGTVVQLMFSAF
ncbi:MAG TPA: hypothetical protein VN408_18680 [Actinoplanes sp.]|nr:hypothetical protein [Actinoplanes sp.]